MDGVLRAPVPAGSLALTQNGNAGMQLTSH